MEMSDSSATMSSSQLGDSAGHVVDADASAFVASVVGMHLGLLDDMTNGGLALQASTWPSKEYRLHELVPQLRQLVTFGLRLGEHDPDDEDGSSDPRQRRASMVLMAQSRLVGTSQSSINPLCPDVGPSASLAGLGGAEEPGGGGAEALAVPEVGMVELAEAAMVRGSVEHADDTLQPSEEEGDGPSLVQTGLATPTTSGLASLHASSTLGSAAPSLPSSSLGPSASTTVASMMAWLTTRLGRALTFCRPSTTPLSWMGWTTRCTICGARERRLLWNG